MKKVIFLIAMCSLWLGLSAQTALTSTKVLKVGEGYISYTGDASDTIKRVADSVYIDVINSLDAEYKLNLITKFAKVANADTTIQITLWGKNSANESYTMIQGATTANVTTSAYTYSVAVTTEQRYRYIRASYRIRATPKSSGVKISQIELKLWKSSGK